MALVHADRVKETSTTTGTGTYDLAGAVAGFQGFVAGIGNGNTCFYVAENGTDWEVGIGTVTDAAPDTLARTTILASSNAGAAVNWGAGTKNLFVGVPAGKFLGNAEGQILVGGARVTTKDLGNLSGVTITPDPGDRPIQKITNNGAGTIAPGSNQGAYLLVVKNTTGAGAITTSGWQDVSGEAFDTTTTSEFLCHCTVVADFSAMVVNKVA